jgi:hypothetical protein
MEKAKEVLSGLVAYEALYPIRALNPPTLEKIGITRLIKCANFEKASAKFDQKMERVKKKIANIAQDIETQKEIMARAKRETTHYFGGPKEAADIAKHNDWVDRGRIAADKHNDLIDRYNEANEEAKEQLEELEREALLVIDDDIVAILQKVGQAAHKLANSANASDDLAAIEVCFLGMKIHAFFVDLIDGNTARKDAQSADAELATLFATLCSGHEGGNHITDRYQRNLYVMQSNGELYQQLVNQIGTVDQASLRDKVTRLGALISRQFELVFTYEGVVDPAELDRISGEIRKAIPGIDEHRAQIERQSAESADLAQKAVATQEAAEAIVKSLKAGVAGLQGGPLGPGDFLCEIVDQETIDDFFGKDVKPAVAGLRQRLVDSLGEAALDQILTDTDDVHYLARADKAMSAAALTKLDRLRAQVPGAIATAMKVKQRLESDIVQIREVPRQNAERFTAEVAMRYMLSFIPIVGVLFAGGVLMRIDRFKAGFSSSNDIYRELAVATAAKNRSMMIAHLIIGAGLGLASLVMTMMGMSGDGLGVAVGVGAAAYFLTALLLFIAGRRLGGYVSATSSQSPGLYGVGA